jgi:hypothetical protein
LIFNALQTTTPSKFQAAIKTPLSKEPFPTSVKVPFHAGGFSPEYPEDFPHPLFSSPTHGESFAWTGGTKAFTCADTRILIRLPRHTARTAETAHATSQLAGEEDEFS